ncbi:MAG: AAA family ATPase [Firmicutes bacterium]|nr:AAA family ATPase [Bacillota bacterium]
MNIKEAKNCLKDAIRFYLLKNEDGTYKIPINRQRPLAMIGPAGVGKTDVARQAAEEMGVNFLSYTITHHTRQSIMGLPRLSVREYEGQEYHVTDYTMSEIISEIHETIKRTGKKEGVLFLDEFNCASETIAPLMLQFLQNKTFGPHKVPEGWVIVLAGNPPEYNKSVKEIDVVTRDRIRQINVEPSFDVWEEYAINKNVHPSILAYLSQNRGHFYHFSSSGLQKQMVTARGWEELSQIIDLSESLGTEVDADLVQQYLACEKICHSFVNYYNVFSKIATQDELETILQGNAEDKLKKRFANKSFDIRCAVIWMLSARLQKDIMEYCKLTNTCDKLHVILKKVDSAQPLGEQLKERNVFGEDIDGWYRPEPDKDPAVELALKKFRSMARGQNSKDAFEKIKKAFFAMAGERETLRDRANGEITHVLDFISEVFGENSEMEILLNSLNTSENAIRLMTETGNPTYLNYKKIIFGDLSKAALTKKVKKEA